MISAVFRTWQDQPRCGCGRAERSRWQDPHARTPARRTSCAAVVESSPSMRWKMSVARNVICWRRLTELDCVRRAAKDPQASLATLARYLLSSCVLLSVRHNPLLYQNEWTNRAGLYIHLYSPVGSIHNIMLWHVGLLPPISHCVVRKFGYLQNSANFRLEPCPRNSTN